jgi:hypothetical protein
MKTVIAIVLAVVVSVAAQGLFPSAGFGQAQGDTTYTDTCINCHHENDMMPEGHNPADIHMKEGLSCAGCHGGDPTSDDPDVAMSEAAGFVGVPDRSEIPHFCGKCHSDIVFMRRYQPRIATDQETQYATSVHGQLLVKGDTKVAVCTSCHTSHSIFPPSDGRSSVHPFNVPGTCNHCHGNATYMADYGIPTDQYAKYSRSVHGKALLVDQDVGAPACNDCHGNHGATPPGVSSIRQVCGQCHVNNEQYFSESRMGEAFEAAELHGCEECHGNHDIEKTSDAMVGVGDKSVCTDCHSDGDEGYAAAAKIHAELDSLVATYNAASDKQQEVRRIGMDDEDMGFLLQESHQSLIQARTTVHTFDPEKVAEKTDPGREKASEALAMGVAQVKEYHVRRRGLGMATLFTTILVIALFFKIRNTESA